MKLCRFDDDRLGLVEGFEVLDVSAALAAIPRQKWPYRHGDALIAHLAAVLAARFLLREGRKFEEAVKRFSPYDKIQDPNPEGRAAAIKLALRALRAKGKALIFDDTFNHEVWNNTDGYRVVLFVDFARPLRQPWHWLNERFLGIGVLAPFLREAGKKQAAWQKKFYR